MLEILRKNPYHSPPPYEKLIGDLTGAYSRRINIQHRLVYQILDDEKVVKVIRMWSLYENFSKCRKESLGRSLSNVHEARWGYRVLRREGE